MRNHGTQIMQAVILILEGDHPVEVKEQALCILANVADGDSAKDYIMGNEDMLKKLMSYMVCISCLLYRVCPESGTSCMDLDRISKKIAFQNTASVSNVRETFSNI